MTSIFKTVSNLNDDDIDKILRKLFLCFLFLVFVTTSINSFIGFYTHDPWLIGDWLINYQGGMIRRGLLGELFYKLSQLTRVNPGVFVFLFQTLFYGVFFLFSYLLLKRQRSLLPYVLLIFSPFIFTFQIFDFEGGYRKEVIYFSILAFVVFSAASYDYQKFKKTFYAVLLIYPALILAHEMLAIYLPYLLVVFVFASKLEKREVTAVILLLIPSVVVFCLSLYFSGTTSQAAEIVDSLAKAGYAISGGAIHWIDKPASYAIEILVPIINENHYYFYYPQVLVLSAIAYIPLRKRFEYIFKNNLSRILILVSLIGSVALFIFAADWGRFLYIHLVSLFLLSLLLSGRRNIRDDVKSAIPSINPFDRGKARICLLIIVFILYSQFWHVPHCCTPNPYALKYTQINAVKFAKPYVRIVRRVFKQ
ncbi:MAG: hypothetical protein OEM82_10470 [Acidobacteriota bacterium]|nr:hypothetical protein [Acidobacteriota bacterium]